MMLLSVLGVTDGVIGPTLLDLKDFIGVTIGQISFILMMSSIGSMVGCFLTGFLLDKFNQFQYLILTGSFLFTKDKVSFILILFSATVLIMAIPFAAFPYCPNLASIYACSFIKVSYRCM